MKYLAGFYLLCVFVVKLHKIQPNYLYTHTKIGGVGKSVDKMSKICYIIGVKDIKVSKSIKKEIVI